MKWPYKLHQLKTSILQTTWTPLHCVVHAGHVNCLRTLLTYIPQSRHRDPPGSPFTSTSIDNHAQEAAMLVDKDGWTIAFIAAIRAMHVSINPQIIQRSNFYLKVFLLNQFWQNLWRKFWFFSA